MPRKKKSTFEIELKPAVHLGSGEPHVFMTLKQPVCFGEATLILSAADIDWWVELLAKAKGMLEER